jgi:hypothetical protein
VQCGNQLVVASVWLFSFSDDVWLENLLEALSLLAMIFHCKLGKLCGPIPVLESISGF